MPVYKYIIYNRRTKKEIWKNSNTACFAEFTSDKYITKVDIDREYYEHFKVFELIDSNNLKEDEDWEKEWYDDRYYKVKMFDHKYGIRFYVKNQEKDYKLEYNALAERFIKDLSKIGLPVKIEYDKDNYPEFILDFKKLKNKSRVILALHLTRYAWTITGPEVLKFAYEYKDKHKCSFWHAFIISITFNKGSVCHDYFWHKYILRKLLSLKEIREIVNNSTNHKNDEMNTFVRHFDLDKKINIPKDFNNTYNNYKKLLKQNI